jgi:hypothetical protein
MAKSSNPEKVLLGAADRMESEVRDQGVKDALIELFGWIYALSKLP